MCSKWNIKHITTSPRYPKSNGLIERQVRTVKGIIHYPEVYEDRKRHANRFATTPMYTTGQQPV